MPAWRSLPKWAPLGQGSEASQRLHRDSVVGAHGLGAGSSNRPGGQSVECNMREPPNRSFPEGNPSNTIGELIWGPRGAGRVEEDRMNVKA